MPTGWSNNPGRRPMLLGLDELRRPGFPFGHEGQHQLSHFTGSSNKFIHGKSGIGPIKDPYYNPARGRDELLNLGLHGGVRYASRRLGDEQGLTQPLGGPAALRAAPQTRDLFPHSQNLGRLYGAGQGSAYESDYGPDYGLDYDADSLEHGLEPSLPQGPMGMASGWPHRRHIPGRFHHHQYHGPGLHGAMPVGAIGSKPPRHPIVKTPHRVFGRPSAAIRQRHIGFLRGRGPDPDEMPSVDQLQLEPSQPLELRPMTSWPTWKTSTSGLTQTFSRKPSGRLMMENGGEMPPANMALPQNMTGPGSNSLRQKLLRQGSSLGSTGAGAGARPARGLLRIGARSKPEGSWVSRQGSDFSSGSDVPAAMPMSTPGPRYVGGKVMRVPISTK